MLLKDLSPKYIRPLEEIHTWDENCKYDKVASPKENNDETGSIIPLPRCLLVPAKT